jgi:hypothetical protein
MNYLKAVFWDYPEFTDETKLMELLRIQNPDVVNWIMYRFLEHGRAIDTLKYFSIYDIKNNIDNIKLKQPTLNKWKRLIEVYGS